MFANPGLPIPRKNRHVHPHRLRWLAAALLAAGAPMAHAIDASGDASGAQLNLNAQLLLVHATATAPPPPHVFHSGTDAYGPISKTSTGAQATLLGTQVLNTGTLDASTVHQPEVPAARSHGGVNNTPR